MSGNKLFIGVARSQFSKECIAQRGLPRLWTSNQWHPVHGYMNHHIRRLRSVANESHDRPPNWSILLGIDHFSPQVVERLCNGHSLQGEGLSSQEWTFLPCTFDLIRMPWCTSNPPCPCNACRRCHIHCEGLSLVAFLQQAQYRHSHNDQKEKLDHGVHENSSK